MLGTLIAAATGTGGFDFTVTPDANSGPGSAGAHTAINVVAGDVLLACLLGFLLSVGMWVIGSKVSNDWASGKGKEGAIVAVIAVFLIGSVGKILGWSYGLGA